MEAPTPLTRASNIPPHAIRFLSDHFRSPKDLSRLPDLEAELRRRCSELETSLDDLGSRLSGAIAAYSSRFYDVRCALSGVVTGLSELRSSVPSASRSVGDGREEAGTSDQILEDELPVLAREVRRVETVRAYAETALKLDRLVGDVEDAVSSVAGKISTTTAVNSEETYLLAISSIERIEDTLDSITKSGPKWTRLVSSVDHRIDRAMAVLRPQAIAEYRGLLSSIDWPPSLSGSKPAQSRNPLFTMSVGEKSTFCKNFLSLCQLQQLQRRRKHRLLDAHNLQITVHEPIWVIEELVDPVTLAAQRYFSKWNEKPELIFTLVYKVTTDFVDSIDDILQPLVDKARLVGYSCREEWVSAMVTSLATYLAKDIFPRFIEQLQEKGADEVQSRARASWLHLVDLMITFDKKIQSLITSSGISLSLGDDEKLQKISFLSVFCDYPDLLELWAEIELRDIMPKFKIAMEDERSWKTMAPVTVLVSNSDDYKSPMVSHIAQEYVSTIIERSRSIPNVHIRARFVRTAGAQILREFLDCLFRRCQEAEGLTALADDDAVAKVSKAVNAARFLESVLVEWCEDECFLEMGTTNEDSTSVSCIFNEEINAFKEFRIEWSCKLSTVMLRGFDASCRDYLKNKKQWQQKEEGNFSRSFVSALDHLQGKMSKLQEDLNELEFVALWRSLASGVDQLLFGGILMSGVKVSDSGVERFDRDVRVLFGVFAAWCLRPEGFFPRLIESLKLLKMGEVELKEEMLKGKEGWLRDHGVRHLTAAEAEKIARNRIFSTNDS